MSQTYFLGFLSLPFRIFLVGWAACAGSITARSNGDAEISFKIQELATWTTRYPSPKGESTSNERNPRIESKGFDI